MASAILTGRFERAVVEIHCKPSGSPMTPIMFLGFTLVSLYSPIIPGHEIVGDLVAVGAGEEDWKVGDRVRSL